jgi:hypothetical protein
VFVGNQYRVDPSKRAKEDLDVAVANAFIDATFRVRPLGAREHRHLREHDDHDLQAEIVVVGIFVPDIARVACCLCPDDSPARKVPESIPE